MGPTARLSIPLPMNLALDRAGHGRRREPVGGWACRPPALLALACTAAVVSGLFDGGYAAQLAPVERLCPGRPGARPDHPSGVLAGRRAVVLRRGLAGRSPPAAGVAARSQEQSVGLWAVLDPEPTRWP